MNYEVRITNHGNNLSIKQLFRKFTIFFLIFSLISGSVPLPLMAQALDSSNVSSASSSGIVSQFPDTVLDASSSASNAPLPVIADPLTSLQSAQFKPPIAVARLIKKNFQAKEQIKVIVRNVSEKNDLKLEIENKLGEKVNARVEQKFVNGEMVFSINPEVGIKPGRYEIRIIDQATNETLSEQDFTWGVLAINTNKSIYAPGETANIAIAVLDEGGRMVCDAVVSLEIVSPMGDKTVLSTTTGSIKVNRECLLHQVTQRPDYETFYVTSGAGRYLMTLTAQSINGSYTIQDRFEVREYASFDVERVTATRIYPPETYPVKIKIKANESFRGKIVESVPQEFQISPGEEGTFSYSEESVIPKSYDVRQETNIPNLPLPFEGKYEVTLGFGQQIEGHGMEDRYKQYGIDGHDGIDFALPQGSPVLSVDTGIVVLSKENWVYGNTIVIEHSWGRSYYGHLSELSVKEGETVGRSQRIALSGSTGAGITGPHLHFGIKPTINDINNLYYGKIDPAPFFGLSNEDPTLSTADYPIAAKALVWNVNIEKGAEFTIGYVYKAPNKSPYFYTIGPLQFITSDIRQSSDSAKFDVQVNPLVLGESTPSAGLNLPSDNLNQGNTDNIDEEMFFKEIRQWQIAADADSTVILDANGDGTCGSGCWTVPSDWMDVNTIYVIGGGGAGDNLVTGGGGGGGGAFASITNLDLEAGNDVNFNVGAGGTDGVNGGNSWFCNNTTSCANFTDTNVVVSAEGGITATGATGGAGGNEGVSLDFNGGAGGTGDPAGDDSTGGGGGAGSPNGTGGTGGNGDSNQGGDEAQGGGGGSGCDSIGTANDGVSGTVSGGAGGDSCFASGGTGPQASDGNPGTNGSGGGGGDTGKNGGAGGDGVGASDPSLAGGGGGGGDDDSPGVGGNGGLYGGGGGGGSTVGTGGGGVIVIVYTQLVTGPTLEQTMRHGKWFSNGVEQPFTF